MTLSSAYGWMKVSGSCSQPRVRIHSYNTSRGIGITCAPNERTPSALSFGAVSNMTTRQPTPSSRATYAHARAAARAESGLLGAMLGWVPGCGLAIKAVTVFPTNAETGRPSHQGLIALFDERNGAPLCVMDGEHITAMRTGGGATVSVRLLARRDAKTLAILGGGAQGHSHLATVPLVREFEAIRVTSRNRARAEHLAPRDPRCSVVDTFEEAARGADVVCCCTDAREPIIRHEWLAPGTHVTSVGGTFGPEIDAETVRSSRVFVEWRGAAENVPPAGARELQGCDPASLTELGEVR